MKNETEHEASDNPLANAGSSVETDGERRSSLTGYARKAWRHLPLFLLIAAIAIASFAYGGLTVRYRLVPYSIISDGLKTLRTLREPAIVDDGKFTGQFVDVQPENAPANRIQFLDGDSLSEPLLWYGGRFQFMGLCPEWGCLAVEFGEAGDVVHAYPLRPNALERAAEDAASDEFSYELAPTFSFVRDVYPIGM